MNCLLEPVTRELIEPEEGLFDFSVVDGLIAQARRGRRCNGGEVCLMHYTEPTLLRIKLHAFGDLAV